MSKVKLKPCPFCGAEPYMENYLTRGDDGEWVNAYSVCCDNELCFYQPYTERCSLTIAAAAERWNRRKGEGSEV